MNPITPDNGHEQRTRDIEVFGRLLAEQMPSIFWTTDTDLTITASLGTGLAALGLQPNQLRGVCLFDYLQSDDPEFLPVAAHLRALRGESVAYTLTWVGRRLWCRVEPLREPDGTITGCMGTALDVTDGERDKDWDELLQLHRLQIDRMPMGYLLADAGLRYMHWNPAAEQMFGFTNEEVLGKHPFEVVVPPASRSLAEALFRRLAAGDMDAHGTWECARKDGRTITCHWHHTPLLKPDGAFVGLLAMAEDVTERRRLEQQFLQAQKMETVGRLAGAIAHDFNNLLTAIIGYGGLLLGTLPAGDPNRVLVAEMAKAGERAATLTRQLLMFTRKQLIVPRVLDLNTVVRDTENLLRRTIGEDISFATILEPHLWPTRADPGQVEQVVMNLVVNARDAMPTGGKLTVETKNVELDAGYAQSRAGVQPGPYVLLAVSDSGHGMTPEVKTCIFEPFFTTKEPGKGTGLGLTMVFGVVQQGNGHIEVYSEAGVGTTFSIYLPRTEQRGASSSGPLPAVRVAPKGSETVLLVEDEEAVRSLSRHVLRQSGYTVLEAGDGQEALRVRDRHPGPIHLLVTDVVMPELGGRLLAERLRVSQPEMKVLYVSGYTDDAVVRHGILHEQVNFLQKPFAPVALASKVREVLDAPPENSR